MKRESGGKDSPSKPYSQKLFGVNSLQLSEDDAFRLVGGVVEKGFLEEPPNRHIPPSSAPRLTVLSFPVARHRSHGPHWTPKGRDIGGGSNNDDEDDAEDEVSSEFDQISAFGSTVQRKEKKGLDFSRWRELMNKDYYSMPQNKEENNFSVEFEQQNRVVEETDIFGKLNKHLHAGTGVQLQRSQPDDGVEVQDVNMEDREFGLSQVSEQPMLVDVEVQNESTSFPSNRSCVNHLGDGQRAMSIESQIDAENRARLDRMSADEIAEVRAEIMEKMNPALIKLLKRQGQEKIRKEKCSSLDVPTIGEVDTLCNEKNLIAESTHCENNVSHQVTAMGSNETGKVRDDKTVPTLRPANRSLWDSWRHRVESVRDLRFSLSGNVVGSDFPQPEPGNMFAHSGYGADNVSERDFLRTEGDPGATGYTIKEALTLTRSVVPGQRALALHLLSSVLDKALRNICQSQVGGTLYTKTDRHIDWEAIWAFTLGPEPELALSLRMSLDDNHNSVVLACAKTIRCVLGCDINESFFEISEKISSHQRDVFTAPIFRSRPEIDSGFLHGGFWKYNAKPSNILPFTEDAVDINPEGEHTVRDDVVVSGQDFVAGFVRRGILPRICYLLKADPSVALEECIISILIAIARHSPMCGDAIMKCGQLVQTVVDRFNMKDQMEITPAKIKSVTLIKVLARSRRNNCISFIKDGIFQKFTWHLYRYACSFHKWVKSGSENCKLSSALLVEPLCFLKVCIQYGCCVSHLPDLFPALCMWLDVPTFGMLIENSILNEFVSITREAYMVVEALARRHPKFYSQMHRKNHTLEVDVEDVEIWHWSQVGPVVDLALKWIALKNDSYISKVFDWQIRDKGNTSTRDSTVSSLLWVISAVIHMLSSVLKSMIPEDTIGLHRGHLPWLPEFVPRIGLEIIKNKFLSFSGANVAENVKDFAGGHSFLEYLCHLRHQSEHETSIASVCCLQGLVEVVVSVNNLIQVANPEIFMSSQWHSLSRESKILADGIHELSLVEFEIVLTAFMKLTASEWQYAQSIEMFGRGGPAPGVGVGWGASGGGFWSLANLLAQMDAELVIHLLEILHIVSNKDYRSVEDIMSTAQRINSALGMCLILGPRDTYLMAKVIDILLEVPVLKYFDLCIHHFLCLTEGFKVFTWTYEEEDYLFFSNILASHFRKRWLSVKRKLKAVKSRNFDNKKFGEGGFSLDTILEDLDTSSMTNQDHYSTTLIGEWAHQRMLLPMHWFLILVSKINYSKLADLPSASGKLNDVEDPIELFEVAKGGLFFLLGIEAMSAFLPYEIHSSVQCVPIIWKLHSLSAILLAGTGILEEEKSRDVYETLQEVYGQHLDKLRISESGEIYADFLRFQSEIDESYLVFIEALMEQFAAVSYGDVVFGRQVAIYLLRCVEAPVRLAAWNAISNAHTLELLPAVEKCIAKFEGYLEPVEDNETILEAYVKSWVSGALDKAVVRKSVAFMLVLHHLASFIFGGCAVDKIPLRNKLVKSLLRDYSHKPQHEGMMMDFVQYNPPVGCRKAGHMDGSLWRTHETHRRFQLLMEACDGNSSLQSEVKRLESSFKKNEVL